MIYSLMSNRRFKSINELIENYRMAIGRTSHTSKASLVLEWTWSFNMALSTPFTISLASLLSVSRIAIAAG